MEDNQFTFQRMGIGALLREGRLVVPLNQRSYAWEDDHVLDLFQDLSNAIGNDEPDYFLGTIVLTGGEDDVSEVSDGQQRLATATILLANIRDYFWSTNKQRKAHQIDTDYLRTTDYDTDETVSRLSLNVDDNEYFIKTILDDPEERKALDSEQLRPSNERIKRACEIAKDHVQDIVRPFKEEDRERALVKWIHFLQTRVSVGVVRVPDHVNAYRMFETLNDRGLRASQADLLKNFLFSRAAKRLPEAQSKWSSITGAIETVGDDDLLVNYIRHFWITRVGPTRERELADKIRYEINNQSRAIDFLTRLDEAAPDYVALFNTDHPKWNEYRNSARSYVQTIAQHLKVEQIRPL